MWSVKQVLKGTPLYAWLRRWWVEYSARRWTPQDQRMADFYSQFVPAGSLCFDVGANIGNRVKILLKLGAQVVAVEPQQECAQILRRAFGGNRGFTVLQVALGDHEGQAEMMISEADMLSSLNQDWIEAVQRSGRFSKVTWKQKRMVRLTTLDRLMEQHGVPAFMKIDVEGFELQVVRGLSRPVQALSLEFAPEFLESMCGCVRHLANLGDYSWNFSVGESMKLEMEEWVSSEKIIAYLSQFADNHVFFGDVYGRCRTTIAPEAVKIQP